MPPAFPQRSSFALPSSVFSAGVQAPVYLAYCDILGPGMGQAPNKQLLPEQTEVQTTCAQQPETQKNLPTTPYPPGYGSSPYSGPSLAPRQSQPIVFIRKVKVKGNFETNITTLTQSSHFLPASLHIHTFYMTVSHISNFPLNIPLCISIVFTTVTLTVGQYFIKPAYHKVFHHFSITDHL